MISKAWKGCFAGTFARQALKKTVFVWVLMVVLTVPTLGVFANQQRGTTTVTPNRLTIMWADSDRMPVSINTFRFHGYNVAQVRTMAGALGGGIHNLPDNTFGFNRTGANVGHQDISFGAATQIEYIINITPLRSVSGGLIQPGSPGWVYLPEFSYNWGSIRDVIQAMELELVTFSDDPATGTTTVLVVDPNAVVEEEEEEDEDEARPATGPPVMPPATRSRAGEWREGQWWPFYPTATPTPPTATPSPTPPTATPSPTPPAQVPVTPIPARPGLISEPTRVGNYYYQVNVIARIPNPDGSSFAIIRVTDMDNYIVTNIRVRAVVDGFSPIDAVLDGDTFRVFIPTSVPAEEVSVLLQ